jgi:uncharacterized protein
MISIGDYNTLAVSRLFKGGCFLEANYTSQPEIYLPKKDTPKNAYPGLLLEVFIYNESQDKLGATSSLPKARVGDFAALEVVEVTDFGAFLDWGIPKDLFLPKRKWRTTLRPGEKVLVYVTLDYEKTGVIGDCALERYIKRDTTGLQTNQEVRLLVWEKTKMGVKVIIDNAYSGLLYRNELFEELKTGEHKKGFIKQIREDGLVDVSLQPQGFKPASEAATKTIMSALHRGGGFLPLHDRSSPEEIYESLHMSKRIFKKTLGTLYKEGRIQIDSDGIREV